MVEAMELLMSAEVNLDNLAHGNPGIAAHPFYKIVKMQLHEGIELLKKTSR